MTKISNLYSLTNYITANSSGSISIAPSTSGYTFDVSGSSRFTGAASFSSSIDIAQSTTIRGYSGTTGAGLFLAYGSAGAGIGSLYSYNYGTSTYGGTVVDGSYVALYNSGAEKMRITGGNVGIGTTSPNRNLEVSTGSDTYIRATGNRGNADGVHIGNIEFYNSFSSIIAGEVRGITGTGGTQSASGQLAFYTNNTGTYSEKMRITSGGNVGIGTTSPVGKLDVALLNTRRFIVTYDDSLITIKGASDTGAGENLRIIGDNLIFNTSSAGSGTERMRITSVGNFDYGGFNVQSSNNSIYRQAFYGALSIMWRNAEDAYLNSNHTYGSSNTNVATYTSSNGLGRLTIGGGNFEWGTYNGSVTAGSAYSITSKFIINSAGNVGIGTSSPSYKLSVNGVGSFAGSSTVTGTVFIQSGHQWSLNADQSGGGSPVFSGSGFYIKNENTATIALGFTTGGAATFANDIRTDGGTVKVGAGSNNYYTQMSTAYNYPYVDSYFDSVAGASYEGRLNFRTSTGGGSLSTKMTIYNNGRLIVGSTADGATGLVQIHGTARAVQLVASEGGITAGNYAVYGHDDNNGYINVVRSIYTGDFHFKFDGTSKANINRTSGAYTATSDSRLKTNIADSQSVLSLINQIKVRSYNWIGNDIYEPYGLIAQELYEIFPQYVYKPKNESENWGLSKGELVPVLVKAIQELKSELDTAKQEIAELKLAK
jgi:hypothetical protein